MAQQQDQICYCFVDSKTINKFMPSRYPAIKGNTIGEVAGQFGLPVEKVEATIKAFNDAVQPGTFNHTILDDCKTAGLTPSKTHWAQRLDAPPYYGYPLSPGLTFTYFAVKTDRRAAVVMKSGKTAENIFAAGEVMAGNILPKGYIGGIGLVIGNIFGRIGGKEAAHSCQEIRLGSAACREGGNPCRTELMREAEKMMTVCNACRYCEGFCAVWPAMEYRRKFPETDLNYLANLCHNCSECYYACQYAPPHEWMVNPPQTFARIRAETYQQYRLAESAGERVPRQRPGGRAADGADAGGVFLWGDATGRKRQPVDGGCRRRLLQGHTPRGYGFELRRGGAVCVDCAVVGLLRFWRDIGEEVPDLFNVPSLSKAIKEVLALKYLDNGGYGCAYPEDESSQSRRWFHHFTFYGFLCCFVATTIGFIYYYGFGWKGPYGYASLPVIFGTVGGLGLVVGPIGLWWLKTRRNREITDESQYGMDVAFIVLLLLTSITGLLLLVLRETAAMGSLLAIHLGIVMTLFLMMPYGKFVHGLYRSAAILKYALERARKKALGV